MPFSLYSVLRNAVQTQNSHRISIIILIVSQRLCAHHSVGQFKFHMVSPAHRHAHANGVVCAETVSDCVRVKQWPVAGNVHCPHIFFYFLCFGF